MYKSQIAEDVQYHRIQNNFMWTPGVVKVYCTCTIRKLNLQSCSQIFIFLNLKLRNIHTIHFLWEIYLFDNQKRTCIRFILKTNISQWVYHFPVLVFPTSMFRDRDDLEEKLNYIVWISHAHPYHQQTKNGVHFKSMKLEYLSVECTMLMVINFV